MVDKHGPVVSIVKNAAPLTALPGVLSFVASRVTTTITPSLIYQYKKRGFYTVTGQFEYWTTTDESAGPPSGNPLIDVTVLQKNLIS
jgi:hypothetical protein